MTPRGLPRCRNRHSRTMSRHVRAGPVLRSDRKRCARCRHRALAGSFRKADRLVQFSWLSAPYSTPQRTRCATRKRPRPALVSGCDCKSPGPLRDETETARWGGSCGAFPGRLANRVAASAERAETPGLNTNRVFRAKRFILATPRSSKGLIRRCAGVYARVADATNSPA